MNSEGIKSISKVNAFANISSLSSYFETEFQEGQMKQCNSLPFFDKNNCLSAGERFQDICAAVAATQFDDLNDVDGGGGDKYFQSPDVEPCIINKKASSTSASLFCLPASQLIVPTTKIANHSMSHVWPVNCSVYNWKNNTVRHNHNSQSSELPPPFVVAADNTSPTKKLPPPKPLRSVFLSGPLTKDPLALVQPASCHALCSHTHPRVVPSKVAVPQTGETKREEEELEELFLLQNKLNHSRNGVFFVPTESASPPFASPQHTSHSYFSPTNFQHEQKTASTSKTATNKFDTTYLNNSEQSECECNFVSENLTKSTSLPLPPYFSREYKKNLNQCYNDYGSTQKKLLLDNALNKNNDNTEELDFYLIAVKKRKIEKKREHNSDILLASEAFSNCERNNDLNIKGCSLQLCNTPSVLDHSSHQQCYCFNSPHSSISHSSPSSDIIADETFSTLSPSSLAETSSSVTSNSYNGSGSSASSPISNFDGFSSYSVPKSFIYSYVTPSTKVTNQCSQQDKPTNWMNWIDEIIESVQTEIHTEHKKMFESDYSREGSCTIEAVNEISVKSATRKPLCERKRRIVEDGDVTLPINKRAKKYSLCSLSHEQITRRKKEQNRIAAQRYRSKRIQSLAEGRQDIAYFEKRNTQLREEEALLSQEIDRLKQFLVKDLNSDINVKLP